MNNILEELGVVRHYIPLYHDASGINGIGLFTPIDLNKGQVIGVSHAFYSGYWYMTTHGNYNHSENPNCRVEIDNNLTILIAKRKILHGEELTVDYREQQFLEQPNEDWK